LCFYTLLKETPCSLEKARVPLGEGDNNTHPYKKNFKMDFFISSPCPPKADIPLKEGDN
jgi:hypothetical protein